MRNYSQKNLDASLLGLKIMINRIYKITEASDYLGVSINTLKTLANNGKIKSFKTTGEHRRFRQEDLDAYMGVEKEKQEK